MSSSPAQQNHSQQDGEEDVATVQRAIKQYQENKITKANVWNCELIDKLSSLVRNHNAYLRNFQNVGISLDATIKVYGIRVDMVFNDVRRLGFGIASHHTNHERTNQEQPNQDDRDDNGEAEAADPRKRLKRKRRALANIASDKRHLNQPLNQIYCPDDFVYKLNSISNGVGDSKGMFSMMLPTKDSRLQVLFNDKFFDVSPRERVEFKDQYETPADGYFQLSSKLKYDKKLMLRPGLTGYRIENTPMEDLNDTSFESMAGNEEEEEEELAQAQLSPDAGDYAFDANFNYTSMDNLLQSNVDSARNTVFDMNNNNNESDASSSHVSAGSSYGLTPNDDVNEHGNSINRGEYGYRTWNKNPNFWAGPSYWRPSHRYPRSQTDSSAPQAKRARRKNKQPTKISFMGSDTDEDEDNLFIVIGARGAKKIRKCSYENWMPGKLRLPERFDIPKDFFEHYTFGPSFDIFKVQPTQPAEVNEPEHNDDDDHNDYPMDFAENPGIGDPDLSQHDDFQTFEPADEVPVNISLNFENAPQAVEKIDIHFSKRTKVVNMERMNHLTLRSIDRQLVNTEASANANNRNAEELEPGKATYKKVYKDLLKNKSKFMSTKSELTPSLVMMSVLCAANKERLRLSVSDPNDDVDFDILQIKRLTDHE